VVFVFKWEPPIINVSSAHESRLSRQNLQVFLSKTLIEIVRAFRFNQTIISIWHCESGSFALQNLRFYRAKQPLLERKTIGFVMR